MRKEVAIETMRMVSEVHLREQARQLREVAKRLEYWADMVDSDIKDDSLGSDDLKRLGRRLGIYSNSINNIKEFVDGAKESALNMVDYLD